MPSHSLSTEQASNSSASSSPDHDPSAYSFSQASSFPSTSRSHFAPSSRSRTTADLISRYNRNVEDEADWRRTTTSQVLDDLDQQEKDEGRSAGLEKPDRAIGRMLKRKGDEERPRKKVKSAEEKHEAPVDAKEDSDDEVLNALDELIGDRHSS
jgi:hypothetical protein